MSGDGLILPCHDCGKAIAIVKVGGVLAYGHLVNPTFMHHEAKPPRMRPAPRSGVDLSAGGVRASASRTNGGRLRSEAPVSGTGYQVRRRVSLSTPAPHSHDRRSSGSTRRTVSSDVGSVPVTSQPFRPSEGASLKRGPSLAPTQPLSAATRSTPPGRS